MPDKRLLDYDPYTGIKTFHTYDSLTNKTYIEYEQDVDPWIELNKKLQNDEQYSRDGIKKEWWHIAQIPLIIQHKWLKEDGIDVYNKDHWHRVMKKLRDPDYRYLRTTSGKF